MRASIRFALAAVLAIGLSATAASAALTSDQFRCQNTVAKQGRKLFKKTAGALSKCRDSVSKGTLPIGTDCTLEAEAAAKISDAETGFSEQLMDKCPDAIVASLDFGSSCMGVTTQADLITCATEAHGAAARSLIDLAYTDPARRCDEFSGANEGIVCDADLDCAPGSCIPISADQRKCQKLLGKTLIKQANKRQSIFQKCKKAVSKDDLPASTNCAVADDAKLDELFAKSVDKIRSACPSLVSTTLAFGGVCTGYNDTDAVAACALCTDDRQVDDLILTQYGGSPYGATASVEQITNAADCVGGPLSRCRVNDYLLANDKIRVVIQDIQRNIFNVGQFGGQIIDGDIVRAPLDPDRDNFEEWSISLNIESTAHYTSLAIINDGSNGGPAILRATGVDDLLDFVNGSSVIAGFGLVFPAGADDFNLPVTVMTDYILEPNKNYVRVETTVQNMSGSALNIFFGEYIGGSGQAELFQPGYGFGEPLVATKCPTTPQNLCNFVAYSGEDDGDGVSYGYVHHIPGSSTFTTSGVNIPQLKVEILLALIGAAPPPFNIAPFGSLTVAREFVVGNGSVSAVTDARNAIQCLPTGVVSGTVTAGGSPAVRADIAILGNPADGPGVTTLPRNVLTHTRTDDLGNYSLTLPPGNYNLVANLDGYPYEGGGSSPLQHPIAVAAFQTVTQNVALPATGALQVTVEDETGLPVPIAAKASVVGFDPSPDPGNPQSILGIINNNTGVFGDRGKDGVPFGLTQAIFIDPSGDSGLLPIEPGDYQVVVSHGPEYSVSKNNISVTAFPGPPVVVAAEVEHVIDSTGFISADFHVHSIDSPDSEVTKKERVVSMLAEGVDFFTPTDHDFRSDFQPTVAALGASSLISTATGEEITSFDYGHFNAWPMTIDTSKVNGGAVDFAGAAADGFDYPSLGSYNLTPAQIIALAHADPGTSNTVQINHVASHFGLDGGSGLAIDTGAALGPQSGVPGQARRLNPAVMNYFTDTFDAMEIWIGDDRAQIYDNFLGTVLTGAGGNIGDWFNLINQGIIRTGVSDSDTHKRIITQAGTPRNMVNSPTDAPGAIAAIADTISANVNAGRTFGTNGPMVTFTAAAASTGETGGLAAPLPTTIHTIDGEADITVAVQSPEWAQFDRIEFYVNTTTTRRTLTGKQTGFGPPINVNRYRVTPDFVHNDGAEFTVTTVPVGGENRLEATTTLHLSGLTEDTWVVALVRGTDGISEPLFPVVPNSLTTAGNGTLLDLTDGNLGENGITAMAFTNPLFIDVDGDPWTAPGLQITP